VSRIADASALAGRAVPETPGLDWAKERQAAERLLSGTAAQPATDTAAKPVSGTAAKPVSGTAAEPVIPAAPAVKAVSIPAEAPAAPSAAGTVAPSPPATAAVAAAAALPSSEPAFSWPPGFDLDAIDLSVDPNARDFRRPRPRMQQTGEFAVQTPPRAQPHHDTAAWSPAPRVSGVSTGTRENAAFPRARTQHELARPERRRIAQPWVTRVASRWVVIALAVTVLLASAALLVYWLQHRQVAAGSQRLRPVESVSLVQAGPNYP